MNSVIVDSPVGRLLLVAENDQLVQLHFESEDAPAGCDERPGSSPHSPAAVRGAHKTGPKPRDPVLLATSKQLTEYFAGRRKNFELPLAIGGTEFEHSVWTALLGIPFGETVSYGEIARRIGNPKSVRAVGRANGKNPIAIIVPCHRVIGSDGSLTGYGGGEPRKRWLLDLESGDRQLFKGPRAPLSTISRPRSNLSRT